MSSSRPFSVLTLLATLLLTFTSSHTVITYPGWRGDNLVTNGTAEQSNGLGRGPDNTWPFGMQWSYPCGGMPMSTNRTKWPVKGGAVGIQPGWFQGHQFANIYINLGDGNQPTNYSLIMNPVFAIQGPNNSLYGGEICVPYVPLPVNYTAKVGNNATIQIIEAAQHGAALYNCVDITFAEPEDVPEVNKSNCANSSWISWNYVYQTASLTNASPSLRALSQQNTWIASIPMLAVAVWMVL